jgi:eukaryotic-like serine/threonine-protein kinase
VGAKLCPQCGTRYEGDNRFCTLDGATLVAENPADSLQGNVLADRYLIDRKLGEGGMGEVYLAEHIRMKRKVAVKVMRAWLTKDPAAIGRFHREAENASQITHANVAAVYDFGETPEGLVYLAMEFVEGESLTGVLAREPVLNHIRASDIVSQTADALAAAHSLGILHRDLKPDNVMIARTRVRTDMVKLLDFGIARVMGRETQHFTSTGLIVGTPEWMSPEQIAGDKLDARSDIYTLGLIAFRMLTGEGAFAGATSQEVLLSKMTKPPRRLSDVKRDVEWPEDLQAAMDRVLATDPASRYDDALAFAADFYGGVSKLPMTPSAEEYYNLLTQRATTPSRISALESTPARGVPSLETPSMPRPGVIVPQLQDTTVLPASVAASLKAEAEAAAVTATSTTGEGMVATSTTGEGAPITGSGAGINVPSGSGIAFPTPVTPMPAEPKRRGLLKLGVGTAAIIVIAVAVTQLGGNPTTPPATKTDSGAKVAVTPPDSATKSGLGVDTSAGRGLGVPATKAESIPVAPVRALGPALDSVANRHRGSVFSVARGRNRSTAFLVDANGLLLTSSMAVGPTPTVDVFLDGSRRVPARVVLVDSARGLAALLVSTRQCPSTCTPIALGNDRVAAARSGDSVVAMTGPTLVSQGSRPKGAVANATAQRLTTAIRTGESGTGSPVFGADGNIVGVIRSGGGAQAMLAPASVLRTFVREATAERTSKSLAAIDSVLPSWPSRPLPADEMAAGVRRTTQDLEAFRVKGRGDFESLVMTPQILALREAEADTMRKYFNPGSPSTTYCEGNGPCDPLETWGPLRDYVNERRAVVVIQIAPNRLIPPRRGEHARADMNRRPVIVQFEVAKAGVPVPPIESHRILSVINASDYPENQRESLYSGLLVFNPNDLLDGGALEIRVRIQGGRDQQRYPIPATVLEAIRRDLASVLR